MSCVTWQQKRAQKQEQKLARRSWLYLGLMIAMLCFAIGALREHDMPMFRSSMIMFALSLCLYIGAVVAAGNTKRRDGGNGNGPTS